MENYTKYNRNVIPGIEESLSKIAAKVTENALVLDVGCSSGMMGRYLTLEKGCIVDGIDIDEKALENCKPVYRKIAIKNLEIDDLTDVLVKESYDFIIVADVIEHLNDPERLLAQLKLLVKPHGTIIFSVPNITHIAASLELLLGNFDYRQNGLLDSTHIRFYSYTNLIAKFNNSGLYAWEVDVVHKDLGETEFGTEQDRLFPRKWLDTLIAVRPDSLVYQWIVTTKIYPRLDQAESHPATKKITATPIFTTALYWKNSAGAGFNETQKIVGFKTSKIENEFTIDFNFQLSPEEKISQIRIDPVSDKKSIWIKSAKISDAQCVILWEWSGKEGAPDLISAKWVDTQLADGRILCAENHDPQWYPEIPVETLQKITSKTKCSVVMCDDSNVINAALVDTLLAANQAVTERDGHIATLNQAVAERDGHIATLNEHIATLNEQIVSIQHSISWRITRPLRMIKNKINYLARPAGYVTQTVQPNNTSVSQLAPLPKSIAKLDSCRPSLTRFQMICGSLNLEGRGVELGPSYNPILPKNQGYSTVIVDHMSADDLRAKYKAWNVDTSAIEEVDIIWKGGPFAEAFGKDERFDYIVASNFIEHIPDPIRFFQDCEKILTSTGKISLVVPDKRFCFDYYKPLTTTGAWVEAYLEKHTVHPPRKFFDHLAYAVKKGDAMAWGKGADGKIALQNHTLEHAMNCTESYYLSGEYEDMHGWYFTPESFHMLIRELQSIGLINLSIFTSYPTHGFEFFVTLTRAAKQSAAALTQADRDILVHSSFNPHTESDN